MTKVGKPSSQDFVLCQLTDSASVAGQGTPREPLHFHLPLTPTPGLHECATILNFLYVGVGDSNSNPRPYMVNFILYVLRHLPDPPQHLKLITIIFHSREGVLKQSFLFCFVFLCWHLSQPPWM